MWGAVALTVLIDMALVSAEARGHVVTGLENNTLVMYTNHPPVPT